MKSIKETEYIIFNIDLQHFMYTTKDKEDAEKVAANYRNLYKKYKFAVKERSYILYK